MPMGCFYKYPQGIVLSVCPYGRKEEANPEGRLYKLIGVGSAYRSPTLFCCSIPYYEYHLSQRREVGWRFVVLKRLYDETTIIGDHGDGFIPPVCGTSADR